MKTIAAIAAALVLFASVSRGQTSNATLVGDVKDATGAFIPDAQVTVTNTATGVSRSVRTGANGA